MAQVRGYSEDDVDLLIVDFTKVVQQSIDTAVFGVADGLTAAGANLTSQDVATITTKWQEQVDGVLTPYIGEVYQGSAAQVAVGLGTSFPDVIQPGVPLVGSDFTLTYLKSMSSQMLDVSDELRTDITNELLNGVEQGYSVPQIAARIKAVSGYEPARALRIARTAVHSAAEAGSIDQMRMVGYSDDEVEKEWLSTHDARTRATHVAAGGQKVPLNGKFTVGGYSLDHPGDTTAPADEVVNCRCTAVFNVVDPPHIRCDGAITAAGEVEGCIVPTKGADISQVPTTDQHDIYEMFSAKKISPAWGGAKILKVVDEILAAYKAEIPDVELLLDREKILAIVDKFYPAKKQTFGEVYHAWVQTPAGKKALGSAPSMPKVDAIKIPIAEPTPQPHVTLPELPPLPGAPDPGDLHFTGKTFQSATKAQVWQDSSGQKWLFKTPPSGSQSYSAKTLLDLETAISRIQSKAKVTRPAIYKATLDGKQGTLQFMFDSKDAFPHGAFDPLKLSAEDLLAMQQEQVFDWMISNHDTHTGQWLRLTSGRLLGIDKGQAFKFFGKDKLDWDYVPVTPLGDDKLTYSRLWKAFVQGKDVDLQDPTQGQIGAYIDQLMAIPDADYRALLKPYAEWRESAGIGSASKFLDQAVARKNSLRKDFGDFWARAQAERAKHVKVPKTAPESVPPQPAADLPSVGFKPASTVDAGDITSFDYFFKKDIFTIWVHLGGGKKVTPAWGGSKIWKMLEDLKKQLIPQFEMVGLPPPTELQLLRVLDEVGGFKGKPKTYESVLMDWLDSPAGKKAVPTPPPSLAKTLTPVAPKVEPIVPIQSVVKDAATEALQTGQKVLATDLAQQLSKYGYGEVVGYAETPGGTLLQIRKGVGDKIDVYFKLPDSTKWLKDKSFDLGIGPYDFVSEYSWKGDKFVSLVPSKLEVKTPTKIPGKMPGDVVTPDEITQSASLWKQGDVVAKTPPAAPGEFDYRLVSNGQGGFVLERFSTFTQQWEKSLVFTPGGETGFTLDALGNVKVIWKLTGDSLGGAPIPSKIIGKSAGDAVTADDIWNAQFAPGQTLAYATDNGWEYRWSHNAAGDLVQEMRPIGSPQPWSHVFTATSKTEIENAFLHQSHLSYKAAKLDGSAPANVKAEIPTTSTKPTVAPNASHIPSYPDDTQIAQSALQDLYAKGQEPFEILAVGENSLKDWRIYWVDDEWLALESKFKNSGTWEFHQLMQSPADAPSGIMWKTSSKKVPPSTVGAKAAKAAAKKKGVPPAPTVKTNAVPGKSPGDTISKAELVTAGQYYEDGQVVAYGKTWQYKKVRIVAVDGQLIRQQQTSAGTWTGSHVVKETWDIPGSATDWKLAPVDDVMTAPQLKAAKKFLVKHNEVVAKIATPQPPAPAPYVPPPPKPVVPITLQHVDITPWSQAEQLEMFEYFKAQGGIYVSTPPQSIWGAIQALKSHFQVKYGGKYAQLNEIEILRIMDAQSALKKGVTDTHPYETKIVQWLKTPIGKGWVNKRIDAPIAARDVPVPMSDFSATTVLPDDQTYEVITVQKALALRAQSHKKYGEWTPSQRAAVKKYTGGSYSTWNAAIRSGDLSTSRASVIAEQQAMRPSTQSMLLHRGTSFEELNDPSITSYETLLSHVGQTYITRGFTSTSVGGNAAFGGQLLIEIEAPVGTPMAAVMDISQYKSEREITLATHLVYKIKSVTKKGGTTVMRVQVIGVGQP